MRNIFQKGGLTFGDERGADSGIATKLFDNVWGSYSVAYPLHSKDGLHHKLGYMIDITDSIKVGATVSPQDDAVTLSAIYLRNNFEVRNDFTLVPSLYRLTLYLNIASP
jgi:hypothetical protein